MICECSFFRAKWSVSICILDRLQPYQKLSEFYVAFWSKKIVPKKCCDFPELILCSFLKNTLFLCKKTRNTAFFALLFLCLPLREPNGHELRWVFNLYAQKFKQFHLSSFFTQESRNNWMSNNRIKQFFYLNIHTSVF